jgi:hypothetical protein
VKARDRNDPEGNCTMADAGGKWASGRSEIVVAGCALLMLLTAQWIICRALPGSNYYTLDGKLAQAVVLTAFKFGAYFDVNNLNPLQGFGTQLVPKNVWANPSFWPFAFLPKETATGVSALIALAIFASAAYVMMRCFDVPAIPSAIAAQLCILLFAPTVLLLAMPTNFCLTPGDAVVYAPYMIALGLLVRLSPDSWHRFALTTAAITALVFYSIYCDPLWTMLAAISWATPFAVVTLSTLRLRMILARGAALACCLAVMALTGAATYLYTLSRYNQRFYFADYLDRPRVPALISTATYSSNMKTFYVICVVGWLLGLVTLRGLSRVLVVAASAGFVTYVIYSAVFLLTNVAWMLPVPLYLEQCLFALYAAGAVAGFYGVLCRVGTPAVRAGAAFVRCTGKAAVVSGSRPARLFAIGNLLPSKRLRHIAAAFAIVCVVILPAQFVRQTLSLTEAQVKARIPDIPWANEPELAHFLQQNIGLAAGQPFRGTVNFLSFDLLSGHTIETLWSHAVPTLNEYSQLVRLYFIHTLLKKGVRGIPNQLSMFWDDGVYTPAYWSAVQLFGVRYSAERIPLPNGVSPGTTPVAKPHRPVEPFPQFDTWYIYELPRPNVGNYSPTEVIAARSGAETMAILARPDFDFARQVVLTEALDHPLVPARDMRLSVIRGGLHVSGRSDGTSLVILPQQYSHCLRARDDRVRFVRADLVMAGLVFSGDIDTDIVFDYGIFTPGCRRADLDDLKRLDLKIGLRVPHLTGDRLFPDWNGAVARLRAAVDAVKQ